MIGKYALSLRNKNIQKTLRPQQNRVNSSLWALIILTIIFIQGCSIPSDSSIENALREDHEERFSTKYLNEYSETVLLRESFIYGNSGGMALDRRIHRVAFEGGGELGIHLLEYFKRNDFIAVEGSRGDNSVYGIITEAGRHFLKNTEGIQENESGYKFYFFEQEFIVLNKREITDGIYAVEFRITCTPLKYQYVPQKLLAQRDIKKITDRINTKLLIKREGEWAVKD